MPFREIQTPGPCPPAPPRWSRTCRATRKSSAIDVAGRQEFSALPLRGRLVGQRGFSYKKLSLFRIDSSSCWVSCDAASSCPPATQLFPDDTTVFRTPPPELLVLLSWVPAESWLSIRSVWDQRTRYRHSIR